MEREFLNWLKQQHRGRKVPGLLVDIGDDAAAFEAIPSQVADVPKQIGAWVVTTDGIADGSHFDWNKHSLREIGHKAMAVNLSDLAAMASLPAFALVTFNIPELFELRDVEELYLGIQTTGEKYGCHVIGGDTNRWAGRLAISVTAIGRATPGPDGSPHLCLKSDARPGDVVFVTGPLGGSILGRHLSFEPRVDLAVKLERFYSRCEQNDRREDESLLASLRQEAITIADEARVPTRQRSALRALPGQAAMWIACVMALSESITVAADVQLSATQQQALLQEALPVGDSADGPVDQERLAVSMKHLQMLVDSGIENDRLYFSLASVAHRRGELGVAVAYYRKALRLNPTESQYRAWLHRAESELNLPEATDNDSVASIVEPVLRWVSPHWSASVFFVAWFACWFVVSLRLVGWRFPWKSIATICLLLSVVLGAIYLTDVSRWVRHNTAVLIADQVTIREADGSEFESVADLSDASGRVVDLRARRGDWMQIELPSGVIGWVHRDTAIAI